MAAQTLICLMGLLAGSVSSWPLESQNNTKNTKLWSSWRHNMCDGRRLPFPFYTKEDWGGKPATSINRLSFPAPFVVIHHTYNPAACFNAEQCRIAMRGIQSYHQDTQGWTDIGYNFAIGSDGAVYEGRGWAAVGAHVVGVNARSIGIAFIGDYVSDLPPPRSLQAAKDLIAIGVQFGFISPSYNLISHRQVTATECPGESLHTEIASWHQFLPNFDVNT